jgi:hypothetical protein
MAKTARRRAQRVRVIRRRQRLCQRWVTDSYWTGKRGGDRVVWPNWWEECPGRLDRNNLTCDCAACRKWPEARFDYRWRWDHLLPEA